MSNGSERDDMAWMRTLAALSHGKRTSAYLGIAVTIWTIVACWRAVVVLPSTAEPSSALKLQMVIIWMIWAVAPPLWFLLQSFSFDHNKDKARADRTKSLDELKYSHELASKFCLGGVAVLSAVLFALIAQKPVDTALMTLVVTGR